jgi:streptogramin lyase
LVSAGAGCDPVAGGAPDEDVEAVASAVTACATKLTPAGATASSIQDNNQTYAPGKAIDGNTTTRWSSAFKDGESIVVNYGQSVSISDLTIQWETAYASSYDVQIGASATGPWTAVYSKTGFAGGTDHTAGLAVVGQYLRVVGTKRATQWGVSIFEITALGSTTPAACVCTPGATQCVDVSTVQTCTAAKTWGAATACGGAKSCSANACRTEITAIGAAALATQGLRLVGPMFKFTDTQWSNKSATVTFDYGDGTAVVTKPALTASAAQYLLNHTYATSGSFTVKATLTNATTKATVTASYPVTVKAASTGTITEFTVPSPLRLISHITSGGSDGKLYMTDIDGYVATITTAGAMTVTPYTAGNHYLFGIVKSFDGNLWMTEQDGRTMVRWAPGTTSFWADAAAGSLDSFLPQFTPAEIAAGPDVNYVIDAANGTVIMQQPFEPGGPGGDALGANTWRISGQLAGLVLGPDQRVWVTEYSQNKLLALDNRVNFDRELAASTTAGAGPLGIAAAANGVYYTLQNSGAIGFLDTTTLATPTEFTWLMAGQDPDGAVNHALPQPHRIVIDAAGNAWFTEGAGYVGRLTPAGALTEFPVPTARSNPDSIALGPDNKIWFLEGGKVARITP